MRNTLFESFAVVLDGWSAGPTHYVGIFAKCPVQLPTEYNEIRLGVAYMREELLQSAEEDVDFLDIVLRVFRSSRNNVVALGGDNTKKNVLLHESLRPYLLVVIFKSLTSS